jgi:protein SCO1/2
MSSRTSLGACAVSISLALAFPGRYARAEDAAHDVAPASTPAPSSCIHHEPLPAAEPLPNTSLYQLKAKLTDQHGTPLTLDAFRGRPVLVAMFYSSCTTICPMLISELQRVEALVPAELRAQVRVLLVSLDPERDTVERLAELATRHGVDGKRWHFARTSAGSVREIAALLGVRYRVLSNGEIGHSALITLLDRDGVIVTRVEGVASDAKAIAAAVVTTAKSPTARAAHKR